MVADLTDNILTKNMPKSAVIALLGEGARWHPRGKIVEKNCLNYDLGTCSGGAPDSDELVVCFDNKDHLIFSKRAFRSA